MRNLIPRRRQEQETMMSRQNDDPFYGLWQNVNRAFDDFFNGSDLLPFDTMKNEFSPSLNISETDEAIEVTAELPGVSEKDVDISLSQDALTIKGEKKQEHEEKRQDYYRMERSYGSFSRVIPLPRDVVDGDKVEASFEKGVLRITLPKLEKAQHISRRIPVKNA
ncbi:MAG: Hsp20/alpha crystallin family protein [Ardenticatenaceae bacterium]|nr:Hsp20/alpha crystallin family protein [Ardenticatenaceae bacterium]